VAHELTGEERVIQGLIAIGAALDMAPEWGIRLEAGFAFAQEVFQACMIFWATEPRIST
jgi:hypothetical protein